MYCLRIAPYFLFFCLIIYFHVILSSPLSVLNLLPYTVAAIIIIYNYLGFLTKTRSCKADEESE